jgi:hypothetical protein
MGAALGGRYHVGLDCLESLGSLPFGQYIAMIDPDFDADDSEGRVRLGETVINIGSQCLEWNATLDFLLRASDLGAAQASAHDHFDALRTAAHGLLNRLLHGPAK